MKKLVLKKDIVATINNDEMNYLKGGDYATQGGTCNNTCAQTCPNTCPATCGNTCNESCAGGCGGGYCIMSFFH